MGNLGQSFGPGVQFAFRIGVLKFIGQDASDRVGIVRFESLRPGLFELDECIAVFGLGRGAGCSEQRERR